jgi:IPT/TIG domain-containing protein
VREFQQHLRVVAREGDRLLPFGNGLGYPKAFVHGVASGGANLADGSVFSLSVGLGPFVKTLPTSGKEGAAVTILGTDLTDATSVTFNGTTTAFTVVSSSEITIKVPEGATSGNVEVTVSGAPLTGNVTFRSEAVTGSGSFHEIARATGAERTDHKKRWSAPRLD